MRIYKIVNYIWGLFSDDLPFFKDGSSIGYVIRNDTISYRDQYGNSIQIAMLYDNETKEYYNLDIPKFPKWEKPEIRCLNSEELNDLNTKIAIYLSRENKPFKFRKNT